MGKEYLREPRNSLHGLGDLGSRGPPGGHLCHWPFGEKHSMWTSYSSVSADWLELLDAWSRGMARFRWVQEGGKG